MTYELHNGFLEAASTLYFLVRFSQPDRPSFFTPQEMKTIDSDIFGYMRESTIYRIPITQLSSS